MYEKPGKPSTPFCGKFSERRKIGRGRDNFPLARRAVFPPCEGVKWILLCVLAALLAGCATDENGNKLNMSQTLKKWEDSMQNTEDRLQSKTYN